MKDFFLKTWEVLKDFFTSPKMKTLYWQTLNGFIVVLVGTLSGIKPDSVSPTTFLFIAAAIAVLNRITKELNK